MTPLLTAISMDGLGDTSMGMGSFSPMIAKIIWTLIKTANFSNDRDTGSTAISLLRVSRNPFP